MVKEDIHYLCEICNADFKNRELAEKCESTPIEEAIPLDTVFSGYTNKQTFYILFYDFDEIFGKIKQHTHERGYKTLFFDERNDAGPVIANEPITIKLIAKTYRNDCKEIKLFRLLDKELLDSIRKISWHEARFEYERLLKNLSPIEVITPTLEKLMSNFQEE